MSKIASAHRALSGGRMDRLLASMTGVVAAPASAETQLRDDRRPVPGPSIAAMGVGG
jgi:hypothetical protein